MCKFDWDNDVAWRAIEEEEALRQMDEQRDDRHADEPPDRAKEEVGG